MELKNQIEAILFAAGKKVTYEELSKLCNVQISEIKNALQEMKTEYEQKNSSLLLTEESDGWKLTVREKYLPIVQKMLPETELPKSILETLAVIAWRHPALQSEIIKIRTNKAYEHIKELEERGFITKEKKGRSYLIKVTSKFHEYFEIPNKEKLKEIFKSIKDTEELQQPQQKLGQLEVYEEKKEEKTEEIPEKAKKTLDKLEVYEVEEEAEEEKEIEKAEVEEEEKKEEVEKIEEVSGEEEKEEEISEKKEEEKEKKEEKTEERELSEELEELLKEEKEKEK